MADEYISREAACRTIIGLEMRDCTGCRRYERGIGDDYCFNEALLAASGAISELPAADVTEVRHGHWIEWDDGEGDTFECSVCGEPWTLNAGTPEENNMHYCPKCGALMDESEDDDDV